MFRVSQVREAVRVSRDEHGFGMPGDKVLFGDETTVVAY
jgi:hypothetical protein